MSLALSASDSVFDFAFGPAPASASDPVSCLTPVVALGTASGSVSGASVAGPSCTNSESVSP